MVDCEGILGLCSDIYILNVTAAGNF